MGNRIEKIFLGVVLCLLLVCITACSPEQTTGLTGIATPTPEPQGGIATPTPEPQKENVFLNVQNIVSNDMDNINYGSCWVKTLEEYNSLGLKLDYEKSFFDDKVLFVIKTEWVSSSPIVTLNPCPDILNNVLHPIVNIHADGDVFDDAMMTMVMIAEVDKKYANLLIGDVKFTFSGDYYNNEENKKNTFYYSMDDK